MRKRQDLDGRIKTVLRLEQTIADNTELIDMGEAEGDQAIVTEAEKTLQALHNDVSEAELETLLSGEADGNDSFLQINAGAGGTESQDWASMLLRMYTRWANQSGFMVEVLDDHPGEEAGIKSATFTITGEYAYGLLCGEIGVHRLVRISPFDQAKRRHTSFASVFVSPEIDDSIEIIIKPEDLRIDTYRSSGKGGQHVNTTDSAVRITHLATGMVAACQNERSQHKNKDRAMSMLRSKLYEFELEKKKEISKKQEDSKLDSDFGSQIRSYVLQPYRMIKDHRTKVEVGDVDRVLDGDLQLLIRGYLLARRNEKTQ